MLYVLDIKKLKKGFREFPKSKSPGAVCYQYNYYKVGPDTSGYFSNLGNFNESYVEHEVFKQLENGYTKTSFSETVVSGRLKGCESQQVSLLCPF